MRIFTQKPKPTQQTMSTIPSRSYFGQSHELSSILYVQPAIGNQSVQRSLRDKGEERQDRSSSRYAHNFRRIPFQEKVHAEIQPKLTVTVPGDIYEQEADRVANQVLQQEIPEKEQTQNVGMIQAKGASGDRVINENLENQLNRSKGSGSPLPHAA